MKKTTRIYDSDELESVSRRSAETKLAKICRHQWENIAESDQSSNDWCGKCGAWKRIDYETGETKIYKPRKVIFA